MAGPAEPLSSFHVVCSEAKRYKTFFFFFFVNLPFSHRHTSCSPHALLTHKRSRKGACAPSFPVARLRKQGIAAGAHLDHAGQVWGERGRRSRGQAPRSPLGGLEQHGLHGGHLVRRWGHRRPAPQRLQLQLRQHPAAGLLTPPQRSSGSRR